MGVPAFFRWLSMRCPAILIDATEIPDESEMGIEESQNPSIDNLYLDMNGIIHPCTHPEGNQAVPKPLSEREMYINIFSYIDKLMRIIRPKKVLYMAIGIFDGSNFRWSCSKSKDEPAKRKKI